MSKPRVIAFYLPQFHPFKENDEWWGKGFTEWTNVGKAKPLFRGHNQPRVPTELGYYDLRMPEVREQQAQMAREAGVEGFMYWHYWFGNGRTLLANIFKEVLESGKPDFPFCLGWANHSWYAKNWNSNGTSTNKLLIEQAYPGEEDARLYFSTLLPAFNDHRYIRVDGKPLFYVFEPDSLPDTYIQWFRKWSIDAGLPGIYLVANIVKAWQTKQEFVSRGFDAVTFQRMNKGMSERLKQMGLLGRFINRARKMTVGFLCHRPPFMVSYKDVYPFLTTKQEQEDDVIPTIIPQWDHTPRSGWNGSLFVGSTPELFYKHATNAFDMVAGKDEQHQIVFLKSWNEWGEGNYMEPDISFGRGYIEALRKAVDAHTI